MESQLAELTHLVQLQVCICVSTHLTLALQNLASQLLLVLSCILKSGRDSCCSSFQVICLFAKPVMIHPHGIMICILWQHVLYLVEQGGRPQLVCYAQARLCKYCSLVIRCQEKPVRQMWPRSILSRGRCVLAFPLGKQSVAKKGRQKAAVASFAEVQQRRRLGAVLRAWCHIALDSRENKERVRMLGCTVLC